MVGSSPVKSKKRPRASQRRSHCEANGGVREETEGDEADKAEARLSVVARDRHDGDVDYGAEVQGHGVQW